MKYSPETLKKAIDGLKKAIAYFMTTAYTLLRIHISQGNKKIGRVHNFSLAPVISCANCKQCMHYCYDIKAVLQYGNVRIARAENYVMMVKDMQQTFAQIEKYISKKRKNKFFRWHVSGDILSMEYFAFMVEIAWLHPDWIFWTYTKNYAAVNQFIDKYGRKAIPKNLTVLFSVWKGLPMDNHNGLPTFECVMKGETPPSDVWECPGNCDICKEAHRGCPYGESAWVNEH